MLPTWAWALAWKLLSAYALGRSSQQPHFHVLLAPEEGELSLNAELEVFLGTRYNCSLQSLQTFSSSRTHHSKETLSLCPCLCPQKSRAVICSDENGPSSPDSCSYPILHPSSSRQPCSQFPGQDLPPISCSELEPRRVQSGPPPGGHLEKHMCPTDADGSVTTVLGTSFQIDKVNLLCKCSFETSLQSFLFRNSGEGTKTGQGLPTLFPSFPGLVITHRNRNSWSSSLPRVQLLSLHLGKGAHYPQVLPITFSALGAPGTLTSWDSHYSLTCCER